LILLTLAAERPHEEFLAGDLGKAGFRNCLPKEAWFTDDLNKVEQVFGPVIP